MRRRYLAGIFVKVQPAASGGMTDRGKGKTFRTAGGRSSNLLLDDGMNELDFQTALHVLVHAHIRDLTKIRQRNWQIATASILLAGLPFFYFY